MSTGGGNDPWAWLGLLKWSLEYTDGTSPSEDTKMSDEDKEFLEKVMKEGIINENQRMKEILTEVTAKVEKWQTEPYSEKDANTTEDLLQELRDIVEQIDFSRAFAAMKGLPFLLGCVEQDKIPRQVKLVCLGLIATVCQHNPPLQKELLELGSLGRLTTIFIEAQESSQDSDPEGQLRARIMQAISANVRSHAVAEHVFCQLPDSSKIMALGLGAGVSDSTLTLRKRSTFLLRALVTSDTADDLRISRFQACIAYAIDSTILVGDSSEPELLEMTIGMMEQLLEHSKGTQVILTRKDAVISKAVQKIANIRSLDGEEKKSRAYELELWEAALTLLSKT